MAKGSKHCPQGAPNEEAPLGSSSQDASENVELDGSCLEADGSMNFRRGGHTEGGEEAQPDGNYEEAAGAEGPRGGLIYVANDWASGLLPLWLRRCIVKGRSFQPRGDDHGKRVIAAWSPNHKVGGRAQGA